VIVGTCCSVLTLCDFLRLRDPLTSAQVIKAALSAACGGGHARARRAIVLAAMPALAVPADQQLKVVGRASAVFEGLSKPAQLLVAQDMLVGTSARLRLFADAILQVAAP